VIEPEYGNPECTCDSNNDGIPEIDPNAGWKCQSDTILFTCVCAIILCGFFGTPIWLFLAKKYGKRNTWLIWSATTAFTNTLFAFCGKGDVTGVIVVSAINGLPIGAKFLADAILADVIDYDEFLTGARSEATYTMFKSFLPKIASIPASAIPISLLGYYGHVSPVDGVIQPQTSASLKPYLYVVFVALPSILAIMAFMFKTKFPLKTEKQNEKIAEGVALHRLGLPANCMVLFPSLASPCSNQPACRGLACRWLCGAFRV
jgi:Na+/melibiose symporter-like transporter